MGGKGSGGSNRKSPGLLKARGTFRKDRHRTPNMVPAMPAPDGLDDGAARVWDAVQRVWDAPKNSLHATRRRPALAGFSVVFDAYMCASEHSEIEADLDEAFTRLGYDIGMDDQSHYDALYAALGLTAGVSDDA